MCVNTYMWELSGTSDVLTHRMARALLPLGCTSIWCGEAAGGSCSSGVSFNITCSHLAARVR